MHRTLIFVLAISTALPGWAAPPPAPEALALIEELDLRASATPVAEHPGWNPRRVVVILLPFMDLASTEYEAALRAAAPDLEIVFERSGRLQPAAELLSGADAVIGWCSAALLEKSDPALRWIHNYSVGMDRCSGFTEKQLDEVLFSNNQRLSAPAIAEHSIAMLLSLSRNFPAYQRAQAEGEWRRQLSRNPDFGELKGKTMLVAGLGGIGTEIARRAHGLGMRVIATRNSSREGPTFVAYVGLSDELHELAGEADVVVNALPLTSKTTGLFDADFFGAVKPGALFLSVGRGRSTVTDDLVKALQSGQLFGAGLDVTDPEPLPAGHPLWSIDNVIITPHVAAAGSGSARRTRIIAVENLRRYAAGEPMLNVVDMRRGY